MDEQTKKKIKKNYIFVSAFRVVQIASNECLKSDVLLQNGIDIAVYSIPNIRENRRDGRSPSLDGGLDFKTSKRREILMETDMLFSEQTKCVL